jgi:catechol 2,3-dioxygenase-like lactoylglutathione lyase family enzyme
MNPRLGFICVLVDNIARSLTFYEHLGFKFPPEAYGEIHVEVELPGGLQISWALSQTADLHTPDYQPAPHGRVTLGFQVDSAKDVDAPFAKLKGFGYKVDRTPWDAAWGAHYAIVYDPDDNLVVIYSNPGTDLDTTQGVRSIPRWSSTQPGPAPGAESRPMPGTWPGTHPSLGPGPRDVAPLTGHLRAIHVPERAVNRAYLQRPELSLTSQVSGVRPPSDQPVFRPVTPTRGPDQG